MMYILFLQLKLIFILKNVNGLSKNGNYKCLLSIFSIESEFFYQLKKSKTKLPNALAPCCLFCHTKYPPLSARE